MIYLAKSRPDSFYDIDSSCFVAFKTAKDAHNAAKELTYLQNKNPQVRLSPEFDDILWDYVGLSSSSRNKMRRTASFKQFFSACTWVILVMFVTAASKISFWKYLSGVTPFVEPFPDAVSKSFVLGLMLEYLTPLLMTLMNFLLPVILKSILLQSGSSSYQTIGRQAMIRFFVIQCIVHITRVGASLGLSLITSVLQDGGGLISLFKDSTFNKFVKGFMTRFLWVLFVSDF